MKQISVAAAVVVALFCSSCAVTPSGYYAPYGTYSVATDGYHTSVAWTNASYDANGFPIFGYSYGRPVYGYTEAGVAIFSIAALTALCFVPNWRPAPWYHGHHHHPHHCHRVAAPPRHPHGHAPGVRPHGGMNAPIHRNPGAVFNKHPKPAGHGNMHRPGNNMGRPNMGSMNRPGNNMGRPNMGNMNRPNNNIIRPSAGSMSRPGNSSRPVNLGSMSRPGASGLSRPTSAHRPVSVSRPTGNMGSMRRPSGMSRPSASFSRPVRMSRPASMSRPSGASRPSGMSRGGGHGRHR